jgi:hypothetical protein
MTIEARRRRRRGAFGTETSIIICRLLGSRIIKTTGKCTKRPSPDILKIPGQAGLFGSGNNIAGTVARRAHFRKIPKTFLLVFNAGLATARVRARRTSRVLPGAKTHAGGTRARDRQPRIVKNKVYTVNTQVNGLTRLAPILHATLKSLAPRHHGTSKRGLGPSPAPMRGRHDGPAQAGSKGPQASGRRSCSF